MALFKMCQLFHVVTFLFLCGSVFGKMTYARFEDDEEAPRVPTPLTSDTINQLPPYKTVKVATIHYDFTKGDMYEVKEVNGELAALRWIFGSLYHFEVTDISIPKTTSEEAQKYLEYHIKDLYQGISGPDSLVILIYGGHGSPGGNWVIGTSTGAVVVDWNKIDSTIIANTDVATFQIIDSCYAAGFLPTTGETPPDSWNGRGTLSVLASASASQPAGSCALAFSKAVIWKLGAEDLVGRPFNFTPSSLFGALPVQGVSFAKVIGDTDMTEAMIARIYTPYFFEHGSNTGTETYKIAPLKSCPRREVTG